MQLFIILVSEDNSTKKFFNGDTLVHNFDTVVVQLSELILIKYDTFIRF